MTTVSGNTRRRRADADRNTAAILGAAATVLRDHPHASIDDIATAAGVSRQTVYSHYRNRDALLAALTDQLTAQVVAALDQADLDHGPAHQALRRLLDTAWAAFDPLTLDTGDEQTHQPVVRRLRRLIRRGQDTGDFAPDTNTDWLVTATLALGHATGHAVRAGRLPRTHAVDTLYASLLAVYRATP